MKNILLRLWKPGRLSSRKGPDQEFGTGLWRHNRDRFIRAVDRYYATSVAIHELPVDGQSSVNDQASAMANEHSSTSDASTVIDGTQRLNDLVPVVDEITAWLHTHHPVPGQVVPGHTRKAVGDTPELLTKASSKVAEAVLAASMARTEIIAGRPIGPSAQATERFITDAAELLERAQSGLAGADDGPDASNGSSGPSGSSGSDKR